MLEITKIISKAFLKEINDKKKTTYMYLSSRDRKLSYDKTSEADKTNAKHIAAVNNTCKLLFCILTNEIKMYENIKLICTGREVAICKKNRNYNSSYKKIKKDGKITFLF